MLHKLSDMTLKRQLVLLIIIAVLMMAIMQMFYYFSFYQLTQKRAGVYFNGYVEQIRAKITSSLTDVESLSKTISNSHNVQKYIIGEDSSEKFTYMNYAIDNLDYAVSSNNCIRSIEIIDRNGTIINSNDTEDIDVFMDIIAEYDLQYTDLKKSFFTHCYVENTSGKIYFAYINPIYSVLDYQISSKNMGVSIVLCKANSLTMSIDSLDELPGTIFMLTDNDFVVTSNLKSADMNNEIIDKLELKTPESANSTDFEYHDQKYIKQITRIEQNNWNIICLVQVKELIKDMASVKASGILILGVTVLLLLSAGLVLIYSITGPIRKIINNIQDIKDKDIKYRIKNTSNNEIGVISKEINNMLDKIEEMTRKIFYTQNALYEIELEKKQAELSFYQNQINPHFLYNTLECIRSMADVYKAVEIGEISNSMAKIFRYSVKEADVVTIENEIGCVNDYLKIMSIRYMGRFKIITNINEKILGLSIIKMVLQPIVENSIFHGFGGSKKNMNVFISGYFNEDADVVIDIIDNGIGMSAAYLEEINISLKENTGLQGEAGNKKSIGLININRRLKLNYGDKFGLKIISRTGFYTAVKMVIPSVNGRETNNLVRNRDKNS